MRRKTDCFQDVHRFQFVLVTVGIFCVIPFSGTHALNIKNQQSLKQFAAVVLKDIIDPVFTRELLVSTNTGEQFIQHSFIARMDEFFRHELETEATASAAKVGDEAHAPTVLGSQVLRNDDFVQSDLCAFDANQPCGRVAPGKYSLQAAPFEDAPQSLW